MKNINRKWTLQDKMTLYKLRNMDFKTILSKFSDYEVKSYDLGYGECRSERALKEALRMLKFMNSNDIKDFAKKTLYFYKSNDRKSYKFCKPLAIELHKQEQEQEKNNLIANPPYKTPGKVIEYIKAESSQAKDPIEIIKDRIKELQTEYDFVLIKQEERKTKINEDNHLLGLLNNPECNNV